MATEIADFFKQNNLPLAGKTLVVATSGGPDSMALLAMVNAMQAKYQLKIIAAHLDHQLRPDSEMEAAVIEQYCRGRQIKVITTVWPMQLHPQKGVEAAARDYRYSFLLKVMRQERGDYLLTAHHCDDLLENILLKFIRSGNPSEMNSLKAVSQRRGIKLLRPLLTSNKEELLLYDRERQVPFVQDSTNAEDDVLRNRLRHHVVPLLKQENPLIGHNALRYSEQMSVLTTLAKRAFTAVAPPEQILGFAYRQNQAELAAFSDQEQLVYWQNFIWQMWHVRVNENLAGFELINYQKYWYIMPVKLPPHPQAAAVKLDVEFNWGSRHLMVSQTYQVAGQLVGQFKAQLDTQLLAYSLPQGAKLLLKNGHHVKSKKKFAQNGIPAILRPYCLTLVANKQVLFVENAYSNQETGFNADQYYVYNIK
ncbi:tRNA lysidine(34) synthetase TilS [Lactobacillus sp. ESL0731]|uniref:tRNA lysidine(34) synthetase TilS n=1 Tax=unclassified Lactobacillus TaxID=2620435 RepID=UPI0023F7A367|nr:MULTISPECIES: tRNA lysidine(34) synthetase TilS [unclassified Lactobacillus]WEV50778.1 tRNA lysidine(34) synthetase TilS [Lactobacillus sp. ESL0700]WEV61909.1 tRNA lysidine(34) synthetase TilS [Lactobacillus sp. ESL0731]